MTELVDQPSAKPTRKVAAGGIAGAVTMIAVWAAKLFGNVDVPAEIAVAISTLVSFATSYLVRERE